MALNTQEAERAVIAVLLTDTEHQEQILNECSAEMFTDPDCRRIFLTAQQLNAESMQVDLSTVNARSEPGNAARLVEISQTFSIPSNLSTYLKEVKDAWQFRTVGKELREALEKAQKHDEDCYADISELQETLLFAGQAEERPAGEVYRESEGRFFEKEQGMSTGFPSLDTQLGGLLPGRLMVLGGRPGMGKSALALSIALQAAKEGAVVLYISLEMTAFEVTKRALAMLSGVSARTAEGLDMLTQDKLKRAGEQLQRMRLYFKDRGDSSLTAVSGAARRVRAKEGRLDLIVIDYVGLMRTERTKTSTRQQEIAEISRGLKRLAVQMPTCVLLLSQLNREADARTDHIPRLCDLRESGDLEQDADVVLFPVRPYQYEDALVRETDARLYIAKNRSGSPGRIDLTWNGATYSFTEPQRALRR